MFRNPKMWLSQSKLCEGWFVTCLPRGAEMSLWDTQMGVRWLMSHWTECFFWENAHVWDDSKIYNFPEICTCATKLTPTFWGSSLFYFFNVVCSLFWSEKFVGFHTLNNCIFVRLVCSHKTNKHQSNCCIQSHPGYVLESLGSYPTLIEAPPSPERAWKRRSKAEIASRITAIVGCFRWGVRLGLGLSGDV